MVRSSIGGCALGVLLTISGSALAGSHPLLTQAQWWQPPPPPVVQMEMQRQQGCEEARRALQEINARWYYAPPWEQQQMAAQRDMAYYRLRELNCGW